jgi:RNA polymerase sigma factor (sigma-70 family)
MSDVPPPREFTTTRWSVVLRAGGASPEQVQAALEQLCRDYWYPLYAYVRRQGHSPEDSADLTQEFFAKLLGIDFTQGLSPERGRFRSFLLTSLNRFIIDEWRKAQRQKRGGQTRTLSLDALTLERGEASYLRETSHQETPEHLYQRTWAETLLARVLSRLSAECNSRGDDRYATVEPFLAAGQEPPSLAHAAAQLGLGIPAFKSLLHRFRQRYRELLFDEVRQTVGDYGDAQDELRGLLAAVRGE